mmetsp:Transcript_12731/g.19069  ORF Transcript_12731/g.19069 Transcript_12731/m.19069 type:complete len:286 (+) Transcript_12731:146-1003(+)
MGCRCCKSKAVPERKNEKSDTETTASLITEHPQEEDDEAKLEMDIMVLRSRLQKIRMRKLLPKQSSRNKEPGQGPKKSKSSSGQNSASKSSMNKGIDQPTNEASSSSERKKTCLELEADILKALRNASAEEQKRVARNKSQLKAMGVQSKTAVEWKNPSTMLNMKRKYEIAENRLLLKSLSSHVEEKNAMSRRLGGEIVSGIREISRRKINKDSKRGNGRREKAPTAAQEGQASTMSSEKAIFDISTEPIFQNLHRAQTRSGAVVEIHSEESPQRIVANTGKAMT